MVLRAPQFVPLYVYHNGIYGCRRLLADALSRIGYYDYPHRIIFLSGMAMGGTTWMKNLLARIPGYYVRREVRNSISFYGDISDSAFNRVPSHGYSLFKTHLPPTQQNLDCLFRNGVEKILVTHRDLRDICVSRYYRLLSDPKRPYAPDYIDYASMEREKALDHSIEAVRRGFVPWIRGWFDLANNNPDIFCFVRFEDLKRDTEREFRRVLAFYGIKLGDAIVRDIVFQAKGRGKLADNLGQARVKPFALSSNFRSGKTGAWKNELTEHQIQRAKELFGEVLIEQGHEKDLNW